MLRFVIWLALTAVFGRVNSRYLTEFNGKIINGTDAEIEDFPYQVSVRIFDQHICGGSIISPKAILTAAHCVHGKSQYYDKFSIRVGNTMHSNGLQVKVKSISKHPFYNPITMDNDITVMQLETPLNFSSTINKIPMAKLGEDFTGKTAVVTGWGVTKEGDSVANPSLMKVSLKVESDAYCKSRYLGNRISENMFCADAPGQDSCQGDSGGPLVTAGELIGVVSWGQGCANSKYPGVYTMVSKYQDWIKYFI